MFSSCLLVLFQGELYVNAESRIIARDIAFDGGVAFGVDTLLVPLEFGGNCDEITERQLKVILQSTITESQISLILKKYRI